MSDKSKNILLGVLIVGLVSMTVAYAALSTSLNISGTATVAATTWNVRIEDWAAASSGNTATDINPGSTSDSTNVTKIENFSATLNKPGDTVTYNFKIANRGTIAAVKSSFDTSITVQTNTATSGDPVWDEGTTVPNSNNAYGTLTNGDVDYTLTCTGDTPLAAGAVSNTCSLTLLYRDLPTGAGQTGQPSQTAGQDQTVNNPARKVTVNASWIYAQQ